MRDGRVHSRRHTYLIIQINRLHSCLFDFPPIESETVMITSLIVQPYVIFDINYKSKQQVQLKKKKKGIEKRHELKKRRAKRVDRSFIYYDYFCATQLLARTKVAIDDIRAVWHIDQVGGRGENLFERKVRDKWDKVRRQVADYRGITRGGLVFPKRSHWKMRPGKCPYFHARYTHNWKVTSYDIHTLSTHKKNNELHRPTFIISH